MKLSLKKIYESVLAEYEDYVGQHQAPGKNSDDSPLHDVTGTYPDDIYTQSPATAVRYYGDGSPYDQEAIDVVRHYKNKPNIGVKIYRAVPYEMTSQDKINKIEKEKKYILKRGKVPPNPFKPGISDYSDYYDHISDELEKLQKQPQQNDPKLKINKGDWVTISRKYAVQHGKSALNGKYKILVKTVRAKDLYTDGNSIHEWGYDP